MQGINMKMQQVKGRCIVKHLVEHHDMMDQADQVILAFLIPTQRTRAHSHQPRLRDRIPAGVQSDLMALAHEFFRQIGHDPFGAAIVLRRHALVERGNLGNLHHAFPP